MCIMFLLCGLINIDYSVSMLLGAEFLTNGKTYDIENRSFIFRISIAVFAVILKVMTRRYRISAKELAKQIDYGVISPSDFTIEVRKIPKMKSEEELLQLFSTSYPKRNTPVLKVVKAYKVDEIIELQSKKAELVSNECKAVNEQNKTMIAEIDKEIEKLKESHKHDINNFTGIAHITFQWEKGINISILT